MIDDINYAVRTLSTSCFSSSLLLSTNNYVFQLLCHMYATNYPTITQASISPWHYTASLMQHKENSNTRTAAKLDPRHQIASFLRSDFQYSKPNKAIFQLSKDWSKSPEGCQHGTVFPSWLLLYHLWTLHSRLSVQFSAVQVGVLVQKSPYVLHPISEKFPQWCFGPISSVCLSNDAPLLSLQGNLPNASPFHASLLQTVIPLQTILKRFFLPLFSTYAPPPPPPPPSSLPPTLQMATQEASSYAKEEDSVQNISPLMFQKFKNNLRANICGKQ